MKKRKLLLMMGEVDTQFASICPEKKDDILLAFFNGHCYESRRAMQPGGNNTECFFFFILLSVLHAGRFKDDWQ